MEVFITLKKNEGVQPWSEVDKVGFLQHYWRVEGGEANLRGPIIVSYSTEIFGHASWWEHVLKIKCAHQTKSSHIGLYTYTPLAIMSRRAPSCFFTIALASCSLPPIPWVAVDLAPHIHHGTLWWWWPYVNKFVVSCCISLCLIEGKPSLGQDSAWVFYMVKLKPPAQLDGIWQGCQLYLKAKVSSKTPLI